MLLLGEKYSTVSLTNILLTVIPLLILSLPVLSTDKKKVSSDVRSVIMVDKENDDTSDSSNSNKVFKKFIPTKDWKEIKPGKNIFSFDKV